MRLFRMFGRSSIILCLLSLVSASFGEASEAFYVRFEVSGALSTYPMSINRSMAVTGYYYASTLVVRGFVRAADGTFSTFDVMGSSWTAPESINDAGEVTGYYMGGTSGNLVPQSFVRYANGRVLTFNPPCNTTCDTSFPYSINAFGEVAGGYPYNNDGNYPFNGGTPAGFSRTRDGSVTSYDLQLNGSKTDGVIAIYVNDSGTVTGFYQAPFIGSLETFVVDARGYLTDGIFVPAPNSNAPYTGAEATVAQGINAGGTIVGWYAGCDHPCPVSPPAAAPTPGAFLRSPEGKFTLFNPPGTLVTLPENYLFAGGIPTYSANLFFTTAPHYLSINSSGSVTGSYTDAAGAQHGFVRNSYGTITSFDPPKGHQTTATSINDNGVITGTYLYDGSNPASVGFLRIPQSEP